MRRILFVALLLLAAYFYTSPVSAAPNELISETTAAQHGLTRPWFAQVELDRSRARLRDLILFDGILYGQTDAGVVHAIDAETGKTLWSKQVGEPNHPSFPPGVNHDLLAVINGSRLYVLNRINGDLLYEKVVDGAPGAGPALSAKRVYVPMTSGMIMAFRLQPAADPKREPVKGKKNATPEEKTKSEAERRDSIRFSQDPIPPLFCQSYGHALVQPRVTRETANDEFVVWPTDRGFLNFGHVDRRTEDLLTLKYRLETGSMIAGQPCYLPPDPKVANDSGLVIAASRDGFVHAVQEKSGERLWQFSAGEPIVESPVVIEDHVYVTTELGGMFCLTVKTGKEIWFSPTLVQFVAASKTRVYATDRIGNLVVLNAANGARLDSIRTEGATIKMLNTVTDRIYLADQAGLIQCLHEIEQTEPIVHGKDRQQVEEPEEKAGVTSKGGDVERPAKKDRVDKPAAAPKKKAGKKKDAEAEDAEGDAGSNPFGQGDDDSDKAKAKGKAGKTGKAGKGKKAKGDDTGF